MRWDVIALKNGRVEDEFIAQPHSFRWAAILERDRRRDLLDCALVANEAAELNPHNGNMQRPRAPKLRAPVFPTRTR